MGWWSKGQVARGEEERGFPVSIISQQLEGNFPVTFPSYPYLDVARQLGVPYSMVLHIADVFDEGATPTGAEDNPLVMVTYMAYQREQKRRELVLSEAGTAR